MNTIWRPDLLNRDPIVVKEEPDDDHHQPPAVNVEPIVVEEEPDDDHHHNPAVNVEPPADDPEEDDESEDLAGKMSTIWRPNLGRLYAIVAEMEVSEREEEEEDATKKGTKRKRAPPTKGPCEHGVKYRSNCKVLSLIHI